MSQHQEEKEKQLEKKANHVIWVVILLFIVALVLLFMWTNGSSAPSTPSAAGMTASSTSDDAAQAATAISVNVASSTITPVGDTVTSPASASTNQLTNNQHMITIQTNKGAIVFETYDADAPNTVKNFVTLANKGFYNGLIFHRVISGFMIQGGDPTGTGTGGPGYTFADELNASTPSYQAGYVPGTVAMANAGPNTNGSQFFIMQANTPLPHAYTIFGHVVSGMDVVNAIATVPVDQNDKPLTPVTMEKVTVAAQ